MFGLSLLLVALVHPPAVVGPRATTDATPTYRFVTRQQGIRFRCSFDRSRLQACSSPYTRRLAVGRHLLRVQAVDRRGRRSSLTRVTIRILEPGGPRKREVRVGGRPFSLVEADGSIWIANFGLAEVERLDPATNRVIARIRVGGQPYGIAAAPGSIWVGNNGSEDVVRIDTQTNEVTARVHVGDRPIGIGYDDGTGLPLGSPGSKPGDGGSAAGASSGSIWVGDFGDGAITRIDATAATVQGRTVVPGEHEDVAFGFGSVWVPNEEGTVIRLDPASMAVTATIHVAADPDFALVADGSVWTTAYQGRAISRIDPTTNTVASTLQVDSGLQGIAFDAGTLWVANYDQSRLFHLDAATGRVLGRWSTGGGPRDILLAGGSVWVANSRSPTLTRLRLAG